MSTELDRRGCVKGALAGSMAMAVGLPAYVEEAGPAAPPAAEDALPRGKIGKLEISRSLLGGNLQHAFRHAFENGADRA